MTEPTCGAEPSSGVPADPRDQALSAGWQPDILVQARRRNDLNEHTAQKVATHMDWALGYFEASGARSWHQITAALSLEWCWAGTRGRDGAWGEPSTSTARNRQWMLRIVFVAAAALGAQVDPHTAAGSPIKRLPPQAAARPLNDEEDRRVRAFADAGAVPSMRSMVVALSRAGGSAPEIAAVRARHVDMDAQTVFFLGDSARTCTLDPWSAEVVSRYLAARSVAADDLLCVKATTEPHRAAQSVTVRLNPGDRRGRLRPTPRHHGAVVAAHGGAPGIQARRHRSRRATAGVTVAGHRRRSDRLPVAPQHRRCGAAGPAPTPADRLDRRQPRGRIRRR